MFGGMTSAYDRDANYRAKIRPYGGTGSPPDSMAPVLQFKLNTMYRKFDLAASDLVSIENQISAILATGTPSPLRILRAFYLSFGREMYKLCSASQPADCAYEAENLVNKWIGRGLAQATLESIRTNVFGVGAPVAP